MSSSERYERRLPGLLEELAAPRMPAYFDDILGQVDRTRQRPGWTFPERWLPMSAVSDRLATMPRFPLRAVVIAALMLLALVAALVLFAGSAKRVVPLPFGSADNGAIAFADRTGSIRSGPADAIAFKVIVPGPGNERPVFSPDGTKLAYLHDSDIVVASPDGSGGRTLNTDGIVSVRYLGWTPDSGSVVIGSEPGKILAYDSTKPGPATLITDKARFGGGVSIGQFQSRVASLFRAPLGDEIAFLGSGSEGDGLYVARRDGSAMRAMLTAKTGDLPFVDLQNAEWSPDGSKIAVMVRAPNVPEDVTIVYLIKADGSGIRRLSPGCPGGVTSENFPAWSPDGTKIALMRWCPTGKDPGVRPITVIDVATGTAHEVGAVQLNGYSGWGWSPDGTSILEVPGPPVPDGSKLLIVNVTSGAVTRTSETTDSQPSWQRTLAAP